MASLSQLCSDRNGTQYTPYAWASPQCTLEPPIYPSGGLDCRLSIPRCILRLSFCLPRIDCNWVCVFRVLCCWRNFMTGPSCRLYIATWYRTHFAGCTPVGCHRLSTRVVASCAANTEYRVCTPVLDSLRECLPSPQGGTSRRAQVSSFYKLQLSSNVLVNLISPVRSPPFLFQNSKIVNTVSLVLLRFVRFSWISVVTISRSFSDLKRWRNVIGMAKCSRHLKSWSVGVEDSCLRHTSGRQRIFFFFEYC